MDFKKYIPSIFAMLLVIAVFVPIALSSGCARAKDCPIVVSQTDGVVVTRLQPSYNLIPVGDEVILTAEVQNKGNAVAENVEAYVWSKPGFQLDPLKANFPLGTLNPPRLDICSAGDAQVMTWRLKAGCDPRESVLAIAVEYDYTSVGWASIFMVSDNEAERTAGKFKEKGENHPSAGPIQVFLEPLQNEPVIISTDANSQKTFNVRAKFKDLGKGTAGDNGEGSVRNILVTTSGPCKFTTDNIGYRAPDGAVVLNKANNNSIVLTVKKQEAFEILEVEYSGDVSTFTKDFCTINVNADYHYRELESVREKMGITGTTSQVDKCLNP